MKTLLGYQRGKSSNARLNVVIEKRITPLKPGRESVPVKFTRSQSFAVTTLLLNLTCASPWAAYESTMLVLYETAMGYALFKLTDSAKLTDPNLYKEFETPERANGLCVQI